MSTLTVSTIQSSGGGGTAATLASINGGPISGARNRIINGDMRIAQRGTSSTTQGYSTVDRFYCNRNGGVAGLSIAQVYGAFSTNRFSLSLQRDSGSTSTQTLVVYQVIEGVNCRDLAGKNVTASFLIGSGSISSTTGHTVHVYYQTTATDIGVTGAWTPLSSTFTVPFSSSFVARSATFTIPATATQLMLGISLAVSGTAGADDRFYITDVQLEEGTVATPFERRSYGQELALCQRYYERLTNTYYGTGYASVANQPECHLRFIVTKRASPTCSTSGTFLFPTSTSALAFDNQDTQTVIAYKNGLTVAANTAFRCQNSASSYIEISAEL